MIKAGMILISMLAVSIWCGVLAGGWIGAWMPPWIASILFTALSFLLNVRVFGIRTLDSYIAPMALLILGLFCQPITRFSAGVPGTLTFLLLFMFVVQWIFEPKRGWNETPPTWL